MTNKQSELFSQILDASSECRKAEEKNDLKKYKKAKQQLDWLEESLKDDMGEDEYDNFINMGRKMFAPKR